MAVNATPPILVALTQKNTLTIIMNRSEHFISLSKHSIIVSDTSSMSNIFRI